MCVIQEYRGLYLIIFHNLGCICGCKDVGGRHTGGEDGAGVSLVRIEAAYFGGFPYFILGFAIVVSEL
jgi:hypothetical protein